MLKKNERNIEVDLLRGFAIIFMILSHSTVAWLSAEDNNRGFSGFLSFVGSFAPVVFFFVTVIVMDFFMRSDSQFSWGWDFLAFIGFSMLMLHFLKGRTNALRWSFVLIGFLFLVRLFSPVLLSSLGEPENQIIAIIYGGQTFKGVSYWFVPWLAYPLAGFILGVLYNRNYKLWLQKGQFIMGCFLFLGLFVLFISLYLETQGMIYFRWGSVSINFIIISFSVLLLSLLLACMLAKLPVNSFLVKTLSISGVSSLAVVPIHYFILDVTGNYFSGFLSSVVYYFLCPLFIYLNIVLAARVDCLIKERLASFDKRHLFFVATLVVGCAVLIVFSNFILINLVIVLVAQILLCVLISAPHQLIFSSKKVV